MNSLIVLLPASLLLIPLAGSAQTSSSGPTTPFAQNVVLKVTPAVALQSDILPLEVPLAIVEDSVQVPEGKILVLDQVSYYINASSGARVFLRLGVLAGRKTVWHHIPVQQQRTLTAASESGKDSFQFPIVGMTALRLRLAPGSAAKVSCAADIFSLDLKPTMSATCDVSLSGYLIDAR